MISADLAHAVHPNKPALADPTNRPVFAGGPTIKSHAGQAYASDAYSVAVSRTYAIGMVLNTRPLQTGQTRPVGLQ